MYILALLLASAPHVLFYALNVRRFQRLNDKCKRLCSSVEEKCT